MQTNKAIENIIAAIEQGIITKSTKARLNELEKTKENLETEIAKKSITYSMISRDFLVEWFDNFKNLDLTNLDNRRMLIDTFVNSVILYDDKVDFYFNYTDNVKSLSVSELNNVSDLASPSPPK
ncbi:MAG: hypothetical protein NC397_02355 [Clostridium sp.]|nr:hypothetical protein [Clostridium sp.]